MENKLNWWGYLHKTGSIHAKRYFWPSDIEEANESPFCVKVVGPFLAKGREEALKETVKLLKK